MNTSITKEQDEVSLTGTNTAWSLRYYRDARSRWREYTDMMETNTNLIAHGVWASNKNTVVQDEDSLHLASSQPFCLESDVAAMSVDIHGRAGSSWHLIQDFTNIACDLDSALFIHQNKGMFLQEYWKTEKEKKNDQYSHQSSHGTFPSFDTAQNCRLRPGRAVNDCSKASTVCTPRRRVHGCEPLRYDTRCQALEEPPWLWGLETYLCTRTVRSSAQNIAGASAAIWEPRRTAWIPVAIPRGAQA